MDSALASLSPRRVQAGQSEIFVRMGGDGPPLLLLHGFPQTHVCWSRIVGALSRRFTVVLADLVGYGESRGPAPAEDGSNYSKRAVAGAMRDMMAALGYQKFNIAGHDRGGRVAYRLALDSPDCVERLAVLSILPTFAMWRRFEDVSKAINTYHWFLLAQQPPIPHDLLLGAPGKQVRNTIASWTKSRTLDAFPADELLAYEMAFSRPEVVAAVCAEYRASWTTDRLHDEADLKALRKIGCPTLVLWGSDEYPEGEMSAAWQKMALSFDLRPIPCGHFVTEEAPAEMAQALLDFFESGSD
ncbi:MAG: alpha/beta fold hydrolase [Parvibaculaceae bacterium]